MTFQESFRLNLILSTNGYEDDENSFLENENKLN